VKDDKDSLTIDILKSSTVGRPRKFRNNAAKQKAYRARKKEGNHVSNAISNEG
jgi:hypothetical protein